MGMVLRILLFACSQIEEYLLDVVYQCILPEHGCASNYKAMASLGFLQIGYQIGTVNMDRCHGSQISRAFSVLRLREHAFLVNEKN